MVEQITELLRKFYDIKLREDTACFEDAIGNLYIIQRNSETGLKLEVSNEIKVTEVAAKELIDNRKLRSIRGSFQMVGGD